MKLEWQVCWKQKNQSLISFQIEGRLGGGLIHFSREEFHFWRSDVACQSLDNLYMGKLCFAPRDSALLLRVLSAILPTASFQGGTRW